MGLFGKLAGKFLKDRTANTKTALQLIVEDFKRYILILKWIFLGFSFATIIYSIVAEIGNLIINCILLGVLLVYALLDAIFKLKQKPDPSKKLRIIYVAVANFSFFTFHFSLLFVSLPHESHDLPTNQPSARAHVRQFLS